MPIIDRYIVWNGSLRAQGWRSRAQRSRNGWVPAVYGSNCWPWRSRRQVSLRSIIPVSEVHVSQRKVALEWYKRVVTVAHGHYSAALRYSRFHFWLGIPSIVLATIVGTSVFASIQQKPDVWVQVLVGMLSMLAALLAALQSFLNYGEKAEKHRIAGARYNGIGRELELLLSQDADWKALESIRIRIDALAQESPHIPESVHREMPDNSENFVWRE